MLNQRQCRAKDMEHGEYLQGPEEERRKKETTENWNFRSKSKFSAILSSQFFLLCLKKNLPSLKKKKN